MKDIKFRYRFKGRGKNQGKSDCVAISLEVVERVNIIQHYLNNDWEMLSRDQFTGLKDANGTDIFEGDIVKNHRGFVAPVCFDRGVFCRKDEAVYDYQWDWGKTVEVIGNIWDNPELITNIYEPRQ